MSHAEIDNFFTKILPLWAPIFENQNSKTLLRIYIYYVTILYRNKMHKLKTERSWCHMQKLTIFFTKILPLWAPIFENQNSKTLLSIYIYYVCILSLLSVTASIHG